jgi:hypothetical protein
MKDIPGIGRRTKIVCIMGPATSTRALASTTRRRLVSSRRLEDRAEGSSRTGAPGVVTGNIGAELEG